MKLSIVDPEGLLTPELNDLLERRLLFALSRFDSRISQIAVTFSDTNGVRGGLDKECCMNVKLYRAENVTVSDQDADVAACIARTAARVGRAVGRAVERARRLDRSGFLGTKESS